MNNEEHKINKTGLKWHHLKHLHISKEVSLKCLHTKARSMGSKHEELENCVQLQGWVLAGIPEMWWMAPMAGVLQWGDTGWEDKEGKLRFIEDSSWNAWSSAWG